MNGLKRAQKWRAVIYLNRHQICLGCFDSPKLAAVARWKAEVKYFGEFCKFHTNMANKNFDLLEKARER